MGYIGKGTSVFFDSGQWMTPSEMVSSMTN